MSAVNFGTSNWKTQFIHNAKVIADKHLKERESTCCRIFSSSTESDTARMHRGYATSREVRPFVWNMLSIGDINIGNTTNNIHHARSEKEEAVGTCFKIATAAIFSIAVGILGYQMRKRADHKDSEECFQEIDRQLMQEVSDDDSEKKLIIDSLLPNLKQILELESAKTNRYAICALAGVVGASALLIGAFFAIPILIPVGQVVIVVSLAASIFTYMADNSEKKITTFYTEIRDAIAEYRKPVQTSAYYASQGAEPIFAEATIVEITFPSAPPLSSSEK